MLILHRRPHERIVCDTGREIITIELTDAGRGFARLGIDAPSSVLVLREELTQGGPSHPDDHRPCRGAHQAGGR
jgi:carbon storage regulator CsrA